jgi:hypothetical protein
VDGGKGGTAAGPSPERALTHARVCRRRVALQRCPEPACGAAKCLDLAALEPSSRATAGGGRAPASRWLWWPSDPARWWAQVGSAALTPLGLGLGFAFSFPSSNLDQNHLLLLYLVLRQANLHTSPAIDTIVRILGSLGVRSKGV